MITTKIENNTIFAYEGEKLVGKMEMERAEDVLTIAHTYAYQKGKGIGAILMEKALRYATDEHLRINPVCSFAGHYMDKKGLLDK